MNQLYNIWLTMAFGTNCPNAADIIKSQISPKEFYNNRKSLHQYEFLTKKQLENALAVDMIFLNKVYEIHQELGIKSISYLDSAYPECFLNIQKAPLALYYQGDIRLLTHPCKVGIIGTRNPDRDGIKICLDLTKSLVKNGALIISGLAQGLDSQGHLAALKEDGKTIAFTGVPLDRCYPASNQSLQNEIADKGLVICEYYAGQNLYSSSFLERNRLIAACSQAVCIVQAKERSGTLATARLALEFDCDVFCVPGSVYNPLHAGTNRLLADGFAKVALSAKDILKDISSFSDNQLDLQNIIDKQNIQKMDQEQYKIYSCFTGQTLSASQIFQNTHIPMAKLKSILSEMELLGYIKSQSPGIYYKI